MNRTRAMTLELAPVIRVNCVCPGIVDSDMARNGFGDITGTALAIDGGATAGG